MSGVGNLLLVFPDQLDRRMLDDAGLERDRDAVATLEIADDFRHVPSHRQRTALLISALRHHTAALEAAGWRCRRYGLGDGDGTLATALSELVRELEPERVTCFRPADWRTLDGLEEFFTGAGIELSILEERHFLLTPEEFAGWAEGRKRFVLEHFYRWMRRRLEILVDDDGEPEGGRWNFDRDNREPLGDDGPEIPPRPDFDPDEITREALAEVERRFPDAPGSADGFAWPVTREQALATLDEFVAQRLPHFGTYQDAMRRGQPWLFHSLLSPALNLKLLDPRECLQAAVAAWREDRAPLNSVEGFVRQIAGWREYVRGLYWYAGRDYADGNALEEGGELPDAYWSGDTEMACLADALDSVLGHGFGHHIQRLMVTGNLALVAGVEPRKVSDWYLGMYVDAHDWVTLPNALGMVMYADGGLLASKPYAASGRYIERMSDYCEGCRFEPGRRHGDDACPVTTFYWDFLARHRDRLEEIPRMRLMLGHLDGLDGGELAAIRERAEALRRAWGVSG